MPVLRTGLTTMMLIAALAAPTATPRPAAAGSTIAITVANTGTLSLDGVFLSLYADRGWGPDQLNGDRLASGGSVTLNDVACTSGSIVAIAEDEAGCFLYRTLSCGGDATWTISNATTRDCGH
jgi:hypothetical protein